jgi:hypothetical protein
MRRFGLGYGKAEGFVAADLERRIADRRSGSLERPAADQVFQPFA